MTADGWPSRNIDVELQDPDPGWIETLFYHLRTLMVENAFNLAVTLPAVLVGFGGNTKLAVQISSWRVSADHGVLVESPTKISNFQK